MEKSNSKFFIIIGILLVVAGIILFQNDPLIASIGVLLGVYNLVKGIRLFRGIQPLVYRKQEERKKRIDDELKDKINQNKENKETKNKK